MITWTRDRLAHFNCPVGVSFTASLARTASGKLQKQAIRASLTSPAVPQPSRSQPEARWRHNPGQCDARAANRYADSVPAGGLMSAAEGL